MPNTVCTILNTAERITHIGNPSISEADEEMPVQYHSLAMALEKISLLRSMYGDSKRLQDVERFIRRASGVT